MAKAKAPSAAVKKARARRGSRGAKVDIELEYFLREFSDGIALSMEQRVKLSTEILRNKIVKNLSVPVTKSIGKSGRIVVTERSKPGEFPRADTTLLMKTIFGEYMQPAANVWDGVVGTPLDYGLKLELDMDRSFLLRTFREQYATTMRILRGPIRW